MRRRIGVLCVVVALMAGCDLSIASRSPTASGGQDLVIGVRALPVLNGLYADLLTDRLIYNGLYRYDNTYQLRPDLADGPCLQDADRLVLTCELRPATFHDGSTVSSADVQFSYQIANSPECRALLCVGNLGASVDRVDAPDDRTVVFHLPEPEAAVAAVLLPEVPIESRAIILAAYEVFAAQARQADPRELERVAKLIGADLDRDPQTCDHDPQQLEMLVGQAERLLAKAGAVVPERDEFPVSDAFDPCPYPAALLGQLEAVIASTSARGIDAIAAAYPVLGLYRHPVGTGPWKVVSRAAGDAVVLTAHDDYHFGRPKIDGIRLVAMSAEAATARLDSGAVDWWYSVRGHREIYELQRIRDARVFRYPIFGDLTLQYNLRPERLFGDINLRKALELCIDKESLVDAATNGVAVVSTSAIPQVSWAHKDEPIPQRDVQEAKRLIETSGWTLAADGIYVKDGRRLEAPVVVRDVGTLGPFGRIDFLDLLIEEVKACGMDLRSFPVPLPQINKMIDEFPHLIPGQSEPFDLYLGGRNLLADPDDLSFESSEVTSPAQPMGGNYTGFSDPRVDKVLAAARASDNVDERARLYATFQDVIYETRAMLFVYSPGETTALSKRVLTGDRPLDSEYWWWELQTLELDAGS